MPATPSPVTKPDFGPQEARLKFITFLRDDKRFTQEDLATRSGYGLDSVKAWFSESPVRRRDIPDRAVSALLASTGYSPEQYRAAVAAL